MDLFLLYLSLLVTCQARLLPRSSNSTVNATSSDFSSTTSSVAVVGDYIAAGLGLSHQTSTLSLVSLSSLESTQSAEVTAPTAPSLTTSESITASALPSDHGVETITDATAPINHHGAVNYTSNAHALASNASTSTSHLATPAHTSAQAPPRSSAIIAGNVTAFSQALALVTAATASSNRILPPDANYNATSKGLITTSSLGTAYVGNGTNFANATNVDQCWAQWSSYWSTKGAGSYKYTLSTGTSTSRKISWQGMTATWETTRTWIDYNGAFPTRTRTSTFLTTGLESVSYVPVESFTETWTSSVPIVPTPPPCALPSYVSDCQSSWEAYITRYDTSYTGYMEIPSCTQARITGSLCSTAISDWLFTERMYGGEDDGIVGGEASFYNVTSTSGGSAYITSTYSRYFPASSTAVPGCTLGCQSCRVSGSHVKLLFWPSETAISPGIATTTAEVYGTTLTRPTVYISFDSLWGLNSCSDVGTPMANVIVPITNTASLSSMYSWGHYFPAYLMSASFNFTVCDLHVTPVPDSIYASQPRCASSSHWINEWCDRGFLNNTICSAEYPCARTLPYEPVLSVPGEVRGLQPAWADCIGGLNGVYDPPLALQGAASQVLPEPPTATNGGSTSAKTTHHSESSPDATTPAAPSPTVSQIVSATNPPPSPEPVQSQAPEPNQLVQTPVDPTNDSQNPNSAANGSPLAGAPNSSQPAPGADPLPSNALDVFMQVASNPQDPTSQNDGPAQTLHVGPDNPQQTGSPNNPAAAPVAGAPAQAATTWTASDGTVVSAHQDGKNVVIGAPGSTAPVSPNGDPVTFAGQTISQDGNNNLVVDVSSIAVPAPGPAAVWTARNGDIASAVTQGNTIVVGDSHSSVRVAPGANAIFDGQTISAAPSGSALMDDGSSVVIPKTGVTPAAGPAATITAANGDVVLAKAQGSNIVFQDGSSAVTVAPGGIAVIDGQTITAAEHGSVILVDGSTVTVPSAAAASNPWTASNVQVFSLTTESNGAIEVAGQSTTLFLTPGGSPIVFDGQTLSAMPSSQGLLVDGSSVAMPSSAATWTAPDGSTITATPDGSDDIVLVDDGSTTTIDSQDGPITFERRTVSALPNGSAVVIDGTTVSVSRTKSECSRTATDEANGKQTSTFDQPLTRSGQATAAAPTSESRASRRGINLPGLLLMLFGFVTIFVFTAS